MEEIESRRFLLRILEEPEHVFEHIRRLVLSWKILYLVFFIRLCLSINKLNNTYMQDGGRNNPQDRIWL